MRAFLAIDPPEAVRKTIAALRDRLRRSRVKASWVRTENLHLTLRFLGDVPSADLARLSGILAESCAGCGPFEAVVRGVGAFPNRRWPSVLWAGVEESAERGLLNAVQGHTERAARAIGLPPDNKRFHPHITLARLRGRTRRAGGAGAAPQEHPLDTLLAMLDKSADTFSGGAFTVRSVSLWSSDLSGRAPVYRRLEEIQL